ncbi:hypothetical protein Tco_0226182 [Tanacetum coccineum]
MCKLLGMTYKKPSFITIEKFEITRYAVESEERYVKVTVVEINKISRTLSNVSAVRAGLMEEIDVVGPGKDERSQLRPLAT